MYNKYVRFGYLQPDLPHKEFSWFNELLIKYIHKIMFKTNQFITFRNEFI